MQPKYHGPDRDCQIGYPSGNLSRPGFLGPSELSHSGTIVGQNPKKQKNYYTQHNPEEPAAFRRNHILKQIDGRQTAFSQSQPGTDIGYPILLLSIFIKLAIDH